MKSLLIFADRSQRAILKNSFMKRINLCRKGEHDGGLSDVVFMAILLREPLILDGQVPGLFRNKSMRQKETNFKWGETGMTHGLAVFPVLAEWFAGGVNAFLLGLS
jgi:hypothetical protein